MARWASGHQRRGDPPTPGQFRAPLGGSVQQRHAGAVRLLVESGHNADGVPIGIPYGSIARMILLYLQTQAVRTQSREVELGASMNAWLGAMGIPVGGKTYQVVREQAQRISTCRLT